MMSNNDLMPENIFESKRPSFLGNIVRTPRSGFTLIELMVAISIIAILAAVGLVSYSSAQKVSRNSKRIQDLKAIQTALETYRTANGSYPVVTPDVAGTWYSQCSGWVQVASPNQVIPNMVPTYMSTIPADPALNTAANTNCYLYKGGSGGQEYKFMTWSNTEILLQDMQQQPILWDPVHPDHPQHSSCPYPDANRGFAVYTLGARCW